MKLVALALALAFFVSCAKAQVSIDINKPGFYGRIDIGGYPPPQLVYPEPVIVMPPAYPIQYARPIYLVVPPGHANNWQRHCHRYNACNQRVYLVQERWYREQYYERHGHRDGRRDDRHDGRRDGRHEGRRDDRDDGRGHGKGKGRD